MKQSIVKLFAVVVSVIFVPAALVYFVWGHSHTLFAGDFTQHLGSIEVSYIQMAKFIENSMPHFAWQPNWYLGYPMSIIYTPLVPVFEYVAHIALGWSFGHAYRVLTGVAYVGGLVSLYFFARGLFKNSVSGLITAFFYALVPSLIAYLYPEVANDRFALDFIEPRRFTILVRWGEGPHIVSLFFVPLAALGWINFLRGGSKWQLLVGAIFTMLTALTNSVGVWALGLLVLALIFGEVVERTDEWKKIVLRSLIMGVLSYGLAAFWFNPLFISAFFQEGGGTLSRWRDVFPWGWLIFFGGVVVYFLLAKKLLRQFTGLTATILFFGLMFWLVNTYYASGSLQIEWVPQVLRLTTEVDLGLSLFAGALIGVMGTIVLRRIKTAYYPVMFVVALVATLIALPRFNLLAKELPPHALPSEAVGKSLTDSAEYDVAKTLESKVTGGERVFVPGNYSFYLNYFTDIPQVRGALFQSEAHPWPEHMYYQLANGDDSDVTLAWLKIANVGWLVYGGPREIYQDYKVSRDKFDEVLLLDEEKQGDLFYKVPLKDNSLAKAVPDSIKKATVPGNAIDKPPIFEYVSLIEASNNEMALRKVHNGQYRIEGTVDQNELVLVQMAHIAGWSAKDETGKALGVKRDPFGFILIEPSETGLQDITLSYTTPLVVWFGRLLTLATLGLFVILLIKIKSPLINSVVQNPKPPASSEDE